MLPENQIVEKRSNPEFMALVKTLTPDQKAKILHSMKIQSLINKYRYRLIDETEFTALLDHL